MPAPGQPQTQVGEIVTFDLPNKLSSAFDLDAFDELVQAHGVRFVHYRGMPNPVGLVDLYDSRRPDPDHSGASNGMVYTKAGCVTCMFSGNSKDLRAMEGGVLNAANAQITPTRYYEGTKEYVYLAPMDRLYLAEESVLVTVAHKVEAHATGRDRLRYPAVQVLDVMDAKGLRYRCGDDFGVEDGQIVWAPGRAPEPGRIYAVRYLHRPYWYVDRLTHEVRVAQYEDFMTGERKTMRMNQCAIIQREHVFENEQKDELAPDPASPRQARGPRDGGLGPR